MISHWTGLVQRKGAGIVERMKLNARLDPEVLDRLMFHQSSQKVPVSDVIANALDALEREQKLPETIMERVENIEGKLALLADHMAHLKQKID